MFDFIIDLFEKYYTAPIFQREDWVIDVKGEKLELITHKLTEDKFNDGDSGIGLFTLFTIFALPVIIVLSSILGGFLITSILLSIWLTFMVALPLYWNNVIGEKVVIERGPLSEDGWQEIFLQILSTKKSGDFTLNNVQKAALKRTIKKKNEMTKEESEEEKNILKEQKV